MYNTLFSLIVCSASVSLDCRNLEPIGVFHACPVRSSISSLLHPASVSHRLVHFG